MREKTRVGYLKQEILPRPIPYLSPLYAKRLPDVQKSTAYTPLLLITYYSFIDLG